MGSLQTGEKISVIIEQCLSDIILVSFHHEGKLFQGALLDSTKRSIPCGVYARNLVQPITHNEPLYSVMQRHSYQDVNLSSSRVEDTSISKPLQIKKKKNTPMTVRLRPRQVLCSNCQGICSENSVNVSSKKPSKALRDEEKILKSRLLSPCVAQSLVPKVVKLKPSDIQSLTSVQLKTPISGAPVLSNERKNSSPIKNLCPSKKIKLKISRPVLSDTNKDKKAECSIRTRSRSNVDDIALQISKQKSTSSFSEIRSEPSQKYAIDEKQKEIINKNVSDNEKSTVQDNIKLILPIVSKDSNCEDVDKSDNKMNLRKKRSIGLMEDLWDESIFEESKRNKASEDEELKSVINDNTNEDPSSDKHKSNPVPVLKISYGTGKATVLKILPKSSEIIVTKTNDDEEPKVKKNGISKAARKALKRARKAALRRSIINPHSIATPNSKLECKSPLRIALSPGYRSNFNTNRLGRWGRSSPVAFGSNSPAARFGNTSPGRFGNVSPGRFGNTSPARFGAASPGRFTVCSPMITAMPSKIDAAVSHLKRHKHKVKHKKKRKEDRKHKSDENIEPNNENILSKGAELDPSIVKSCKAENYDTKKLHEENLDSVIDNNPSEHQNTRHKLSISIKRVNNASYIACDSAKTSNIPPSPPGDLCESNVKQPSPDSDITQLREENFNYLNATPERDISNDSCNSCDEVSGEAPDFPFLAISDRDEDEAMRMFMALEWSDVDSCQVSDCLYRVGDVVWGKANSHPWWPAKIINLKMLPNDNSSMFLNQAQVSWYGSPNMTLLPVDALQHFLMKFSLCYRRHGEAVYQRAVRQAKEDVSRGPGFESGSGFGKPSTVSASPRQVDVFS